MPRKRSGESAGSVRSCTIPSSVNHLLFYNGTNVSQSPKYTFTIADDSSTPLVIDGCVYAVCAIVHTGTRTVVLQDSYLNGYQSSPGAGNLFIEDDILYGGSVTNQAPTFYASQKVWARQFDIEQKTVAYQFNCQGSTLWVLGYKTENGAATPGGNPSVLANGCQMEVFGHFYYPLSTNPAGGTAATQLTNSSLFDVGKTFVTCTACGWQYEVQETGAGSTLTTTPVDQSSTIVTGMYFSYGASTSASTGLPEQTR